MNPIYLLTELIICFIGIIIIYLKYKNSNKHEFFSFLFYCCIY